MGNMSQAQPTRIIIQIDNHSFDVTEYATKHPGGAHVLRRYHNRDATEAFNQIRGHHDAYVEYLLEKMEILPIKDHPPCDSPIARC
jgi:cytochrome b involved in lipid metabolism